MSLDNDSIEGPNAKLIQLRSEADELDKKCRKKSVRNIHKSKSNRKSIAALGNSSGNSRHCLGTRVQVKKQS